MKIEKLNPHAVLNLLPHIIILESEKVLLNSALEKKGVFTQSCQFYLFPYHSELNYLLAYDHNNIYPLGETRALNPCKKVLIDMPLFKGLLGVKTKINTILSALNRTDFVLMDKDFKILTSRQTMPYNDKDAFFLSAQKDLVPFCEMRAEFLYEETGKITEAGMIYERLKNNWRSLLPAVIKSENKIVGMVSSHFHCRDYAMISMLYIKKDKRGNGLARRLMNWYISRLYQTSAKICLFHTPDNYNAKYLYDSLGFEMIDEWLLSNQKVPS